MSINIKEKFNVDLSRWTSSFTSATVSQDRGTLRISSSLNGGFYTNPYRLTGYGITGRTSSSMRLLFIANTKSATPSTIGIGFYQIQTVGGNGHFQMLGGVSLYANDVLNNVFQNQLTAAASNINSTLTIPAYSIGDIMELILTSKNTTYTTAFRNLTKQSPVFSLTREVLQPFTSPSTERVYSDYVIYIPNGNFNVLSFNVGNVLEDAKYAFVGDSITKGFSSGPYRLSWSGLVTTYTNNNILCLPADAASTADILTIVPELISYPSIEYVFLLYGGNDPLFGIGQSTTFANYDSFVTQLKAAGKKIVHLLNLPRSTGEQALIVTLNNHISSTYTTDIVVDTYTPLKDPSSAGLNPIYQSDALHPNALGHGVVALTIKNALPTLFPVPV